MGVGHSTGHQHQIRVDLAVMSRDKSAELVVAYSPALEWLTALHTPSSLLTPGFPILQGTRVPRSLPPNRTGYSKGRTRWAPPESLGIETQELPATLRSNR